jgi:protein O-mannosyl-transferase
MPNPAVPANRKVSFRVIFGMSLLMTLALYGRSLFAPFHYDDHWFIVRNASVREIVPVSRFFLDPASVAHPQSGLAGRVYRPLAAFSFAVDYRLWKLRPAVYRFENFLLHALAAALAFVFFTRSCGFSPAGAAVGVATFLVHPAQVESVVWISQRSNIFCLIGLLAGLVCLAGRPGWKRTLAGLAFLLFALFAKENAAVLIALLVLHNACFRSEEPPPPVPVPGEPEETEEETAERLKKRRRKRMALYASVLALTGFYVLLRSAVLERFAQRDFRGGWLENALVGAASWWEYLKLLIVPLHTTVSHDQYVSSPWQSPWPWVGVFCLAGYLGIAAWRWRKDRAIPFFLFWILIALSPVLGLVPIDTFVAERFLYVPLIGLGGLTGIIWERSGGFAPAPLSRLFSRGAVLTWTMALALLSFRQAGVWRDEMALWRSAVEREPHNAFARSNLAEVHAQRGEIQAAIHEYSAALSQGPSLELAFAAMNNLAELYNRQGEARRSLEWSERALQIRPDSPPTLYNRIVSFAMLGEKEKAFETLARAEDLAPASSLWPPLRERLEAVFGKSAGVPGDYP